MLRNCLSLRRLPVMWRSPMRTVEYTMCSVTQGCAGICLGGPPSPRPATRGSNGCGGGEDGFLHPTAAELERPLPTARRRSPEVVHQPEHPPGVLPRVSPPGRLARRPPAGGRPPLAAIQPSCMAKAGWRRAPGRPVAVAASGLRSPPNRARPEDGRPGSSSAMGGRTAACPLGSICFSEPQGGLRGVAQGGLERSRGRRVRPSQPTGSVRRARGRADSDVPGDCLVVGRQGVGIAVHFGARGG